MTSIQTVTFESALSDDEVLAVANKRSEQFRALPGLLQKYYIKLAEPSHYGGVYVRDSMESLQEYRSSELASTIAGFYTHDAQSTERNGAVLWSRKHRQPGQRLARAGAQR